MEKTEQEARFDAIVSECRGIMLTKGDDYAGADRLSNFKVAGAVVGLNAPMNCLNLIGTKVARLGQLIGFGKKAKHESVRDSIIDLINYAMLLEMILHEEGVATKPEIRSGFFADYAFFKPAEKPAARPQPVVKAILDCWDNFASANKAPTSARNLTDYEKAKAKDLMKKEWKAEGIRRDEVLTFCLMSPEAIKIEGRNQQAFNEGFIGKYGIETFKILQNERLL